MTTATGMFMDALEKWLHAARGKDFARAAGYARDLVRNGELLVIHPEFVRCFQRRYPGTDPRQALLMVAEVLACATGGRERVLTQWADQTAREPTRE